jgi:hypothetical protein
MRVSLSVFVSIFADNKFKDLNESTFSNIIEQIKLQLIWFIFDMIIYILESSRTNNIRNQPLYYKWKKTDDTTRCKHYEDEQIWTKTYINV